MRNELMMYINLVLGVGVLALVFSAWKTNWINRQDEGTDRMKTIGANISEGAMAFLKAEYRVLAVFVVVVACLLVLCVFMLLRVFVLCVVMYVCVCNC